MTNSKSAKMTREEKQEARRAAIQASQYRINLLHDARSLCSLKTVSKADHARGLELMAEYRKLTGHVG